MSDALGSIVNKLKPPVRLLSSPSDGEALGAARAIVRTLNSVGLSIHELADGINDHGGLTEAEMRKIYDAGHQARFAASVASVQEPDRFHTLTSRRCKTWQLDVPSALVTYAMSESVSLSCKCARGSLVGSRASFRNDRKNGCAIASNGCDDDNVSGTTAGVATLPA
jgi:hypothetical protein